MITLRPAGERGRSALDWLDSRHTFSFSDYHDPAHMGFRVLRVINEDWVKPGAGFGMHPHRDMEIITYLLEGTLEHKDSLGTGSVIRPGEIQRMSAGTGVTHSEWNHSKAEPVHLLQIWIVPAEPGIRPSYEQKAFDAAAMRNRPHLVASPSGREGSLTVHQDVNLYAGRLEPGREIPLTLAPNRHAWVQMARGAADLNGVTLKEGDGAAVTGETRLVLGGVRDAEILVFDLP